MISEPWDNQIDEAGALQGLAERIKAKFEPATHETIKFLLVGRTRVGKSSTVNSLVGREVAPVGDLEPMTFEVRTYPFEMQGIRFSVIDTPGLCDDVPEKGNDEEYLQRIHQNVPEFEVMFFVSRLGDYPSNDERRAISLISRSFTSAVWKRALLVFTHAAVYEGGLYAKAILARPEQLRREILKHGGVENASEVPAVVIDNKSRTTPDGKEWIGELYAKLIDVMPGEKVPTFFVGTAALIRTDRTMELSASSQAPHISLSSEQKVHVGMKIGASIIPLLTTAGAGVGSPLGLVGGVIGGVIGCAIGVYVWFATLGSVNPKNRSAA